MSILISNLEDIIWFILDLSFGIFTESNTLFAKAYVNNPQLHL